MLPQDADILSLLPQRPPFICIDRLALCQDNVAETEFRVQESHLFCEQGRYTEAGIVETIAQTCAARIGYISLTQQHAVFLGIIGSIRNCVIHALPPVGTLLTTRITVCNEIFGITQVEAVVSGQNRIFATCEMKISLTDIESQHE